MNRIALPALPVAAAFVAAFVGALPAGEARAQSSDATTEFQIEVLVIEPIDGRSDDWPVEAPGRFDGALDPRVLAEAGPLLEPAWSALEATGVQIPQPLTERTGRVALDDDDAREADDPFRTVTRPPLFAALESLPQALVELRERVDDSSAFEPVTALAWLQPAGRPRQPAPMRIHDGVVVDRESIRDEAVERPDGNAPRGRASPNGSIAADHDPRFDRVGHASVDTRERWRSSFRLDGTLALVRRQFLHVDLDLQWQTPIQRLGELRPGASSMRLAPDEAAEADGWRVHRLRQSRVVRPDRWEYFDSERFGVLVRVTELDPLLPLPPPEPPAPAGDNPDTTRPAQAADPLPDAAERARGR